MAAYLSHDDDEAGGPEQSGLASHVGASDEEGALVHVFHLDVVGNELLRELLLEEGVTHSFDVHLRLR